MIDREVLLGPYEVVAQLGGGGARAALHVGRLAARRGDDAALFVVRGLDVVDSLPRIRDLIEEQVKSAAKLDDPRVLPLREVFEDHGQLYVAGDLVLGETLRHLLDAGARPPKMVAAAIARELASVLASMHGAGLVHGDVCPSLVMLGLEGSMMLRDPGVAKVLSSTGKGTARGHYGYMSPERAAARGMVDATCDVYSLGLILWELLTGTKAVRGTNDSELRANASKPQLPAPSTISKCGRELDAIVHRATRAEREDRYPDAAALFADLDRYIVSRAPSTNVKAELAILIARHLGSKMRAQKLLVDRWASQSRSRPSRPAVPAEASSPTMSARPRPVSRAASIPPVRAHVPRDPAEVGASLFAELDLAVQDLAASEPVELAPMPRSRSDHRLDQTALDRLPRALPPGAASDGPTDDLNGSGKLDVRPVQSRAARSKSELIFMVLLAFAMLIAFANYLFTEAGQQVLEYWWNSAANAVFGLAGSVRQR